MKLSKLFALPCLLAATAVFTGVAHASPATYQIKVLTVGSSAQFGVFAEAAYQLATADGAGTAKHYTLKGGTSAWVNDSRTKNGTVVANEYGNLWVVWSETSGNIWAYLSVDSTVGVRAFQAVPRATLGIVAQASLPAVPASGTNLFVWDDGSSDTLLSTGAYNAISGSQKFTAANTDIRPEDALFATRRALAALDTTAYTGLGYGSGPTTLVGTAISSQVSTAKATPVNFDLSFSTDSFGGKDPFSGSTVPVFVTIPVGAAPIVFIANSTNTSGLGATTVKDITTAEALKLFSGAACDAGVLVGGSANVPVYPYLREALSGTMNTTEFNVFRPSPFTTSQEQGVLIGHTPPTGQSYNPLNLNCTTGGGVRQRGVGTGDVVKGVNGITGNIGIKDGIGYVFFSYEALNGKQAAFGGNIVNSSTNAAQVKYLTLNGVDPINTTYSGGAIPVCGSVSNAQFSCGLPANAAPTSFPNLRNGTYTAWSEYRVITDAMGTSNAQALVTKADLVADSTLPDFVPYAAACRSSATTDESGLSVYREHFTITGGTTTPSYGIAPTANNGAIPANVICSTRPTRSIAARTIGGSAEEGGDVGGTIVYTAPGATPVNTIETSPVHY